MSRPPGPPTNRGLSDAAQPVVLRHGSPGERARLRRRMTCVACGKMLGMVYVEGRSSVEIDCRGCGHKNLVPNETYSRTEVPMNGRSNGVHPPED